MTKAEIRLHYRQERARFTEWVIEEKSKAIAKHLWDDTRFRAVVQAPGAVLHTFLPIRRQHEVDTWPLIRQLWRDRPDCQVAAAVTQPATRDLRPFRLGADTRLRENRWGIPEPAHPLTTADWLQPGQIDLVCVPLLALDKYGHRVGYGGGYYDRFLAQTRPDCLTIGLTFFPPIERIDDVEPTDVPVHGYADPTGVYWLNT